MKGFLLLLAMVTIACSKPSEPAKAATKPSDSATAATNETTYAMTATIVSRDPAKNTVNLDNKEVPGKMMAMKMDYELRGAKVTELPPDGSPVEVTVHDVNGSYYISDVKAKR